MSRPARERVALFSPPAVDVERRPDGTLVLRSPAALQPYPSRAGAWLEHWAEAAPDRLFLQERGADGLWHGVTYAEAAQRVQRLGAGLLQRDLSAARPIAILSDNGLEHALLMLAAMHVGIPVAPLSPAYSLLSRDFGKLRAIVALLQPGLIFVADQAPFAAALAALQDAHDAEIVAGGATVGLRGATPLAALYALGGTSAVDRAAAAVTADTIAKFLFTSGSTGEPKAVINTHRMLCASQQARVQTWPFLAAQPPVIVDWLPWSHTFGGNHNFNLVLRNGGTLYIDAGKPAPGLFARTVANLREIAPTIYFNVPRGYDMLIDALRADAALRGRFFSRLRLLFYAGAALPQNLWDALGELAKETLGRPVPMVTAWGSTETAPLAADCHFQAPRSGVIGIPVPGTELKLVPENGKLEIRVRGANVTPGYWRQPELTREAFDEESFYRIGDAVRFLDPAHPERGLVFDGRIAEDFKLSTGTRVHVGNLRIHAIAALAPVAQDIVVTGHDGDECGFLIFPNVAACRAAAGLADDAPLYNVLAQPAVRERVRAGMAALRDTGGGTSSFATRALLLLEPPAIDAGEITDKGYINQRAVREHRAGLVALLHADPPDPTVITL
ncbi:MAG: feruloyl-CoA synthase [Betaproteobacteria bacterium]|nr:feruloyl-CoA synthase [Betaproteobacteria bacterium]